MIPLKLIYVSGTRADYGLMREVLKRFHTDDVIDLSICVTGMHLSCLYGNTLREIEADGFRVCGMIPVDIEQCTHISMAKSLGYEIIGMTEVFAREQPSAILLLGDRGEMLAAAIVAVHLNIPIIHFHGGERSGTIDEMIRHSISKLAHYHFVATEQSRQRLIKMGERGNSIFVVGAPGLDEIHNHKLMMRDDFYNKYRFDIYKKTALFIYHPVVQESLDIKLQFQNAMNAILHLDLQVICLEPNSDAGGHLIRDALHEYKCHPNVRVIKHLLRSEFIDCLGNIDVMVGNSSSGIIEAASFGLMVVNVGSRQSFRECGDNVINVAVSFNVITEGLKEALQRTKRNYKNIYGDGKTSGRCLQLLKALDLNAQILNKCNVY